MTISNLKVGFKQPGDAVKYTFNIENRGTIDASLEQFSLGTPSCTNLSNETVTCPSMTYEVKCGSPLATPTVGTDLLAGQTIPCTYYLAYNEVSGSNEYSVTGIEVDNITATFKYTQKSTSSYTPQTTVYKLTLNSMGGSSVSNIEALGGSEITLPEPTKSGYDFDGWYTEEEGGTKITSNTMPTSNTTYYAHWTLLIPPICKKATTLHTETCSQTNTSYYCSGDGYTSTGSKGTTTITYGHTNLTNGEMTAGYALDCKVSTTGDYTERFYYVSDYFDPSTNSFDSDYATLIYYNNVSSGVASETAKVAYYSSAGENWHGPTSVVAQLPTTDQWNNIVLKSNSRQIYATSNGSAFQTSTSGGNLPSYSYSGKAARLLTYKEAMSACPNATLNSSKGLSNCIFLLENTKYSTSSYANGSWLETPRSSDSTSAWATDSYFRQMTNGSVNISSLSGARPVIEIPKSKIQLQ